MKTTVLAPSVVETAPAEEVVVEAAEEKVDDSLAVNWNETAAVEVCDVLEDDGASILELD